MQSEAWSGFSALSIPLTASLPSEGPPTSASWLHDSAKGIQNPKAPNTNEEGNKRLRKKQIPEQWMETTGPGRTSRVQLQKYFITHLLVPCMKQKDLTQ